MEQSVLTNAIRILLFCIVLWSLIFFLMSKLRIPDRFLDGLPMEGRNIIVIGLILCVVCIQLVFNGHWRAAFDGRWWTYRMDWYIMFFTTLKLPQRPRRPRSGKNAAGSAKKRGRLPNGSKPAKVAAVPGASGRKTHFSASARARPTICFCYVMMA